MCARGVHTGSAAAAWRGVLLLREGDVQLLHEGDVLLLREGDVLQLFAIRMAARRDGVPSWMASTIIRV